MRNTMRDFSPRLLSVRWNAILKRDFSYGKEIHFHLTMHYNVSNIGLFRILQKQKLFVVK